MKFKVLFCAVLSLFCIAVNAHKYKSGECPAVEPASSFEMKKFLGIWYAIQKTSTASECVIYNISQVEPGQYLLQQLSQDYLIGVAPVAHRYSYTGELETRESSVPSIMSVKFPLNVLPGDVAFKVFMTDYEHYAGIFTCQKLPVGHRQSATILSRTKDLDRAYIDKLRTRLQNSGVDPFDLSIIKQANCPSVNQDTKINVDIDPNTFSAQNIGSWVRKAGEKIGDGVEWTIEKSKNLYTKVKGGEERQSSASMTSRSGKIASDDSQESASFWFP